MALDNNAVLTAAKGYIFTAPVGTPAPTPAEVAAFTDGSDLTGWDNLGHTAREELPEFGFDGGVTEPRGTWQAEALRTVVTDPAVDYVTFTAHQFVDQVFVLGSNSDSQPDEEVVFAVTSMHSVDQERALSIVIIDGQNKVAFHALLTGLRREEAMSPSVDEFAGIPIRATFLTPEEGFLFSWITGIDSSES